MVQYHLFCWEERGYDVKVSVSFSAVGVKAPEHWWYVTHHAPLHGNHGTQERQERNFSTQ